MLENGEVPIVLCGSESWELNVGERIRVRVFNMECLRKVFRVKQMPRRLRDQVEELVAQKYFCFMGP